MKEQAKGRQVLPSWNSEMKLLFHKNKHLPSVNYLSRLCGTAMNLVIHWTEKKLKQQNFHSPVCLHQKSLKQRCFPLVHQAIPFFLLPCLPFFPIRLPFSFLACRWFIHTGYWPLSSNRVFLLRLLSMSIFPSVKDKDYLIIIFLSLTSIHCQ